MVYLNLRILETNSGSPVFMNKAEVKHFKMMFHEQKNIMKRVGFLDDVSRTFFKFMMPSNTSTKKFVPNL